MKTSSIIAVAFILILMLIIGGVKLMHLNRSGEVRYIQKDQVFVVTLSGEMDEHSLIRRVEALKTSLKHHLKNNMPIKLLIDFRGVKWDSEKTHYKARAIFADHLKEHNDYSSFSAILNDKYDFQSSEQEAFFTKKQDAINWLRKQTGRLGQTK